jgi:hypothetical protein
LVPLRLPLPLPVLDFLDPSSLSLLSVGSLPRLERIILCKNGEETVGSAVVEWDPSEGSRKIVTDGTGAGLWNVLLGSREVDCRVLDVLTSTGAGDGMTECLWR